MACTIVNTLRPGMNPPLRSVERTVASISSSSPRRATKVATTISPASATNPGSSKTTPTRSIARDTGLTESASWCGDNGDVRHRNRPRSGGLSRGYVPYNPAAGRCLQAKYEEPNDPFHSVVYGGGDQGYGRFGHGADHREPRPPGRPGAFLLRLLG